MSLRLIVSARTRALVMMSLRTTRRRASSVHRAGFSQRARSPCRAVFHAPIASVAAMHASPLTAPHRAQSSLQKLLNDPNDPYLAALQHFDILRIADIVAEGPAKSGVPAAFLQRVSIRVDTGGFAAARAELASPTPLTQRPAQSSGEAVLQSLHAAGIKHRNKTEAVAAAELQSAQEAYDALPQEEKTALQMERLISHLFDGLCAMSAALRMQAEEGSVSAEERDAAFSVYERIMAAHRDDIITADRWSADFVPELAELQMIWKNLGDARAMPLTNKA